MHIPESEKEHFREHPEEIFGYERATKQNQKHEIPSGNAPLSQAQLTGSLPKEGFDSIEGMINHLHDMEKVGSPEEKAYAKEALAKMTHKFLNQLKNEGKTINYEDKNFEILKKLTENKRRREIIKRQKGTEGEA